MCIQNIHVIRPYVYKLIANDHIQVTLVSPGRRHFYVTLLIVTTVTKPLHP